MSEIEWLANTSFNDDINLEACHRLLDGWGAITVTPGHAMDKPGDRLTSWHLFKRLLWMNANDMVNRKLTEGVGDDDKD